MNGYYGGPGMYPAGPPQRGGGRNPDALAIGLAVAIWTVSGGCYLLGLAVLMMAGIFIFAAGGPTLVVVLAAALPVVLALSLFLVLGATPYFRSASTGSKAALLGAVFTVSLVVSWGGLLLWGRSSF